MAHKRAGNISAAIAELERAVAARKGYAAAHRSLGILYRQRGNLTQAMKHLERTAELAPKSGDAHYSLGLAYFKAGRRDEALRALKRAAELKPEDAQVGAQLGVLLLRTNPQQAATYLERAVKAKPGSAYYHHQLGVAYRRGAGRAAAKRETGEAARLMKQAQTHLTRALSIEPTATLYFDLGVLFRRLKKPAEAIEHLENAVKIEPRLSAAWWDLGHMYTKTKQHDAAIAAFKRYLVLEGGSKDAPIARQRLEQLERVRRAPPSRSRD